MANIRGPDEPGLGGVGPLDQSSKDRPKVLDKTNAKADEAAKRAFGELSAVEQEEFVKGKPPMGSKEDVLQKLNLGSETEDDEESVKLKLYNEETGEFVPYEEGLGVKDSELGELPGEGKLRLLGRYDSDGNFTEVRERTTSTDSNKSIDSTGSGTSTIKDE